MFFVLNFIYLKYCDVIYTPTLFFVCDEISIFTSFSCILSVVNLIKNSKRAMHFVDKLNIRLYWMRMKPLGVERVLPDDISNERSKKAPKF